MKRLPLPGLNGLTPNTIFCIGRNYEAHARELNNPVPKRPVIFTKPITSLCFDESIIPLPADFGEIHYETEIVVAIGKAGRNIPVSVAEEYIAGYAIGIDFTARDLQSELKQKSHPWEIAKGLDNFAPVSSFVEKNQISDPNQIGLRLLINGEEKQHGNSTDMIFPIVELISHLSRYFTLNPGDLVFTGTPEGVGPVKSGDKMTAILGDHITSLNVTSQAE